MPSVCKKRAQNRVTFKRRKIEEKRPVLSTGRTHTSKGQLPRLVRTLIREQLPRLVIGGTLIRKGQLPWLVIGGTLSPKEHFPGRQV